MIAQDAIHCTACEITPLILPVCFPVHFARESIGAILFDIEGTTSSISFVRDTLFPYAKEHIGSFLAEKQFEPAVAELICDVREMANTPEAGLQQVIDTLLSWIEQDQKLTPLKTLQGLIWEEGYLRGDLHGHVYEDALAEMQTWKERGTPLYVYSSGSVQAQKLLFGYSNYGDLTYLFTDYFDTKVGTKKQPFSYLRISEQIGIAPQRVLFLSDSLDELDAAKTAGMQTVQVCREGTWPRESGHPFVYKFDQIRIEN